MYRTSSFNDSGVQTQGIYQFIPPDLRRMFYKNPARVHASHNGLDPYGFSTDGLVLYLPLWALKDSAFKSVDAYQHTCEVTNATWGPTGRLFAEDGYIQVPAATSIDAYGKTALTLSAWINASSDGGGNYGRIFGKNSDNTMNNTGQGFFLYVFDELGGAVKVAFAIPHATTAALAITSTTLTISAWHKVDVTYNEDSDKKLKVYFDAALATLGTDTAGVGNINDDSALNLRVGNNSLDALRGFDGYIGEVWEHSRALSAGEILHNYKSTAFRYQ